MGMLRTLIVVGAAIALMPSPPPDERGDEVASNVGAFSYVAAAAETVADMRSFCQRNPNVCATAGAVAVTMEGKAKYSAKLIYEWANDVTGDGHPRALDPNMAAADPIQTSAPPPKGKLPQESQNTLTLADLVTPWKKPKDSPKG
jgi:Family of unknown function (DUF5330)